MVTIVDVKERVSQEGNPFMALIVQSDLEIVKSVSGNFYANARKASIPSTLEKEAAQMMVGKELPGTIKKQECELYETTNSDGELITLDYRYFSTTYKHYHLLEENDTTLLSYQCYQYIQSLQKRLKVISFSQIGNRI